MLSAFFIKNPVFAGVLSIIVFLVGLISMFNLPIEQYPRVLPPQILVSTAYPGASADTIAKTVAAPLEEKINGAKNMLYMNSLAEDSGRLTINVFFEVGTDPDDAKIDVNNRVQAALSSMPEQVKRQGVVVGERSPSILLFAMLQSPNKTHDSLYLSNYALLNMVETLKRVDGVGDAMIFGAKDYSIRVWIDPAKLSKYSLATTDVITAIQEQNNQYAAGKVGAEPLENKQMYTYTIKTPDRFSDPKQFSDIVIRANADGSSLKLKDVAHIELGASSYSVQTRLNNAPSLPIGVFLQSGANSLETAKAIKKALEEASKNFPEDMTYTIPYDSTDFITASIEEVVKTFVEALLLVILIIFIFLQSWRATIIPLIAVPISIVGAFAGMYVLGFSINLLTLFGLVLAIGIVVDDAIIVIENIERHMDEGKTPLDAAFIAMKEVTGALIAIILVLAAVFVPVAFMGGLSGEMYRQFAITIVISVIISGFVAITLTPSLCVRILKNKKHEPKGFAKWFNNMFDKATTGYSFLVKKTIRYSFISLLIFGGLVFVSWDMFKSMKTGLVPDEDQGTIFVFGFNPPGSSLSRSLTLSEEINAIVAKDPNVQNIITLAGYDFTTSAERSHTVATIIKLKDWSERPNPEQHAQEILGRLSKQLMGTSEGFSFAVVPPPIMGMSVTGGFDMYVQDRTGGSIENLGKVVNQIIEKAKTRPELMGVRTSLAPNVPMFKMDVDVEKAKAKGVNINDIYSTINATFGSYYVNDFSLYGRTYKVNLQAIDTYRNNINNMENIFVRSNKGELLPLSSFVSIKQQVGADIVERFNLFQAAKVSGQPAAGYSSGDALKAIEEVSNEVLPEGYTISWVGTAYQEKQVGGSSAQAFIFGIVFLFLILCALYERWLLPIAVVLAVPFAIFGAILATNLRGLDNNIYFQIGLLVLAGLAAKNAILIVEFALQKRKEGFNLVDSALEAAKVRLRPIVMTSLAFTIGVLPLAIGGGAGAASKHSIGTGVIGGMLTATFIAIIFIPLFYILISKISKDKKDEILIEDVKKEES
ncbi:efflux RND transporter permease subunit [Aliarcobacter cibarius]|uniref:Multidrug efflux RND transporter permease subunit n=1 Tax=Aliarcobacter cibarius TaxID=255507 RepID=A0A7L5JPS5_9BACT|nr:multidrug efflux RND transporter permease subunit [Aliarcobacter cibarius]QKJ27080.1 RND family efflux system, inner membrane transporter, AcrB family [Aliarcobacter cibarius]TLS98595.1 multidrug efflux RND transporter permease subunit [Aliarcobacter cibarius]TLS99339.1 multidrug efflux RND transporter permease subunit [Aliarcobacter cibarius]